VKAFLEEKGAKFQVLAEHAAVKTIEEAAEIRGATLASGAKAFLYKDTKSKEEVPYVMAIMSASARVDNK